VRVLPEPDVIIPGPPRMFQLFEVGLKAPPESPVMVLAAPVVSSETAPAVTVKSEELNEAIPLFVDEASSPAIVSVAPEPEVSIPSPPTTAKEFAEGVTVPESVVIDVGIVGTSEAANAKVMVAPLPDVDIPVPPVKVRAFADGVALPVSAL
tara:strand:+ start:434 stop:889 length:456 start_codon:yes stop_codon:yes gene_type:complete